MVIIPTSVQRAIQAHGETAYPNEGAGLLLGHAVNGSKTVVDILPVENEWDAGEQYHRDRHCHRCGTSHHDALCEHAITPDLRRSSRSVSIPIAP